MITTAWVVLVICVLCLLTSKTSAVEFIFVMALLIASGVVIFEGLESIKEIKQFLDI